MSTLVINENGVVRIEKLDHPVTRIGRDPANEIHIDSMEISRFHCQIQKMDEGFLITDLNSRNGTVINGSYARGVFLSEGDMIHLGDISIIFKKDSTDKNHLDRVDTNQFKVIEEERLKELTVQALERDQLLKLQEVSVHIASLLDMDRLLQAIMEHFLDLVGCDRGFIMLLDEDNRLKIRVEKNMKYAKAHPHEKKISKELIEEVLSEQKIVSVQEKLPTQASPISRQTVTLANNTMVAIPLKAMAWKAKKKSNNERREISSPFSQFLGVVYLASRKDVPVLSTGDTGLIEAISHHSSIALSNAKLHHMATTDKLTNLYNRGYFETLLQDEMRKAKHTKEFLSVVMTDIDHFKKFNDTYGHQIGDQVLQDVSKVIKDNLRQDDIAARYGGEELVFILPKTSREQACIVAEKIRKAIELAKHTEQGLQVTISLGTATFPNHSKTKDILMKKADQALYRAKDGGRNCWRQWEESYEVSGETKRTDSLAGILSGDQAKNYQNTQLLLETIAILSSSDNLEVILEKLLDKINEITHADRALIFLADSYGNLQFQKGRSAQGKTLDQVSMYSRSIPQRVFTEGKACCLVDDGTDSSASGASASMSMGRFQLQTVMCVPLRIHSNSFGVLYVDSQIMKQEFKDEDLIFLEALANQISIALHQARTMEEKLREEVQKRKVLEDELKKLRQSKSP